MKYFNRRAEGDAYTPGISYSVNDGNTAFLLSLAVGPAWIYFRVRKAGVPGGRVIIYKRWNSPEDRCRVCAKRWSSDSVTVTREVAGDYGIPPSCYIKD